MKRALVAAAIATVGVAGTLVATNAPASATVSASAAGSNGCTTEVDNPHFSSGAPGIIAKAYWTCEEVPTTIYLDVNDGNVLGFYLFLCTTASPEHSLVWLDDNCTQKGLNISNLLVSTANTKSAARYVPPSDDEGAQGSGYWIAVANWQPVGPGGTGAVEYTFSNTVPLTYKP